MNFNWLKYYRTSGDTVSGDKRRKECGTVCELSLRTHSSIKLLVMDSAPCTKWSLEFPPEFFFLSILSIQPLAGQWDEIRMVHLMEAHVHEALTTQKRALKVKLLFINFFFFLYPAIRSARFHFGLCVGGGNRQWTILRANAKANIISRSVRMGFANFIKTP